MKVNRMFCKVGDVSLYYAFSLLEIDATPLLFVCRDDNYGLYLCLSGADGNLANWSIVSVEYDLLARVIAQEIDLYSVFVKSDRKYLVFDDAEGNRSGTLVAALSDDDMPDKGMLLEYHDKKRILIDVIEQYFAKVTSEAVREYMRDGVAMSKQWKIEIDSSMRVYFDKFEVVVSGSCEPPEVFDAEKEEVVYTSSVIVKSPKNTKASLEITPQFAA